MTVRAAVHVHSSWSYDAKVGLDELAAEFARRHYDVVFMCEHDRGFDEERWQEYSARCAEVSRRGTLVIPGIEYADPYDRVHIPVWGDLPFLGEALPTTELLAAVSRHGGVALLAHPARRNAWDVVDPAWFSSLAAIEFWTRKWDGWAPNLRASEAAVEHQLVPVASLDLHRTNQFFPLAMELAVDRRASAADCVNALASGRCRPILLGMPALSLGHGVVGRIGQRVEQLRRPVARRVRSRRAARA